MALSAVPTHSFPRRGRPSRGRCASHEAAPHPTARQLFGAGVPTEPQPCCCCAAARQRHPLWPRRNRRLNTQNLVWAWEPFVPTHFYLSLFHQAIEQVTTTALSAKRSNLVPVWNQHLNYFKSYILCNNPKMYIIKCKVYHIIKCVVTAIHKLYQFDYRIFLCWVSVILNCLFMKILYNQPYCVWVVLRCDRSIRKEITSM